MRVVRRLWAICISTGIVLLSAFLSAVAVDTGEWYCSLAMPVFAINDAWYTPVFALVYVADVVALSFLFYGGASGFKLYLPLSSGVLNVFWCYVFFVLNSVAASIAVLALIVAWTFACAVVNMKKFRASAALFLLKGIFFSYLLAVLFSVR